MALTPDVEPTGAQSAPASRGRIWTGRAISGLVIAFSIMDGAMKVIKPEPVIKATVQMGFPESTLTGMGVALLLSTVAYAIPRASLFGAILLTAYLGGAVAAQVRAQASPFSMLFPILFAVLVWAGLALRDERLWRLIFHCPAAKS